MVAVPTTLEGTAVPTMIVGTNVPRFKCQGQGVGQSLSLNSQTPSPHKLFKGIYA